MLQSRAEETLRNASHHLIYEYTMSQRISVCYFNVRRPEDWVTSVYLESLLIHLRYLLHFSYSNKPRDTDIIAQNFFDDPSIWETGRPPITDDLTEAWGLIDKKVAHLTYNRTEEEIANISWATPIIGKVIQERMQFFLNNVPKNRLCTCEVCQRDLKWLNNITYRLAEPR